MDPERFEKACAVADALLYPGLVVWGLLALAWPVNNMQVVLLVFTLLWACRRLRRALARDPWGRPYRYTTWRPVQLVPLGLVLGAVTSIGRP